MQGFANLSVIAQAPFSGLQAIGCVTQRGGSRRAGGGARDVMQHWAFSRGLGGILVLIDFARRHGMSLSDTLAESGITQAQLRQPNADVAATQELRVITNIVQRLGDPVRLGLDMGLSFHFATYGIWGLALISSATGRDAMQFALRSLPLTHAFTTIDYEETEHHAALVFGEPGLPPRSATWISAIPRVGSDMHHNLREQRGYPIHAHHLQRHGS